MLHALQHPCIVSLIGISIHPLCFALELAPLGSLNTVLSENAKGTSHAQNLPGGCRAGHLSLWEAREHWPGCAAPGEAVGGLGGPWAGLACLRLMWPAPCTMEGASPG